MRESRLPAEPAMDTYNGPFNPRCVFGSNPKIVYQKILAFLETSQTEFAELDRFRVEVESRLKISLELLQGIKGVYILVFSEKSPLNEKLLTFLDL